ncbi:MAG: hypothetical protein ACREQ5_33860 [Candidatus Dormibacteria bacterium]
MVLDLPEVELSPAADPVLLKSTEDGRFGLTEEAFLRWWRALGEDDKAEFVQIYGGNEVLARFVCAYDYLTMMEARSTGTNTIRIAYSIALGVSPDDVRVMRGYPIVWKHDAVQSLLDRLHYRSAKQAAARITNKVTILIENMLVEVSSSDEIKEKNMAVRTALDFMRQVSDADVQERVERTKRGFQQAREELRLAKTVGEEVTPDQAVLHLSMLKEKLGDNFDAVLKKALNP